MRPSAAVYRRRRAAAGVGLAAVLLAAVLLAVSTGSGSPPRPRPHDKKHGALTLDGRGSPAAIEAGVLPWSLPAPLSRAVAFPGADGHSLVVAGGLQASGASTSGILSINTTTGAARTLGNLAQPLHDAAGAVVSGKGLVFGGGSAAPGTGVEQLAGLGGGSSSATATTLPPLPQARADDAAAVIGRTAYIVGGYNGPSGDSAVLATTDGRSYHTVAQLPVAVRYPAVAALGGKLYVFGGDAVSGPGSGKPVADVQVVDPSTGRAVVAGSLPEPIAGAAAAALDGVLYLAGGETTQSSSTSGTPTPVSSIWAWIPATRRALTAGHLMVAVSHAAAAVVGSRVWLVGGESGASGPTTDVQMFERNAAFGVAGTPGAGSPYYGDKLLIADRGNNRLLVLDDTGKITWRYPSPAAPAPPGGFYFPDDAFFTRGGKGIISNQEQNETIVQLSYPGGKVTWSYGHPHVAGSAPGYLNNPDDAYLLKNGDITVADPMNCRVLVLTPSGKIVTQIGTTGACQHNPSANELGSPNGDTPLVNGDLLVSEINGSWVDEYTVTGHLVWSAHVPIAYPSDPQPLANGRYLMADYVHPGAFVEFDRSGKIVYQYRPTSGPGELNQPSLVELLPSGVFMSNDDYNDRMVAVDPATGALVWQYGKTATPGTAPGYLNTPDGFDLLGPNGSFPTHPPTG